MRLESCYAIGVWSDRDSSEIREALRIMGMDELPIRYLDGDDAPAMYKDRDVEGEPVPMAVLRAMEADADAPWMIRDRMLAEMGWSPGDMTWEEWKMATEVSSKEEISPKAQCSAAAPGEKVDLISLDAVNAINALIPTQLDLYSESESIRQSGKE
jgi:hypothetical protein